MCIHVKVLSLGQQLAQKEVVRIDDAKTYMEGRWKGRTFSQQRDPAPLDWEGQQHSRETVTRRDSIASRPLQGAATVQRK
jgi:hypothetical protein